MAYGRRRRRGRGRGYRSFRGKRRRGHKTVKVIVR